MSPNLIPGATVVERLKDRIPKSSPLVNLMVATTCTLVCAGVIDVYDTPPETLGKTIAEKVICHPLEIGCPWEEPAKPLLEGLAGGKLTTETVILRGMKAVDARVDMQRTLPTTDVVISTSTSTEKGTVGIKAGVDGLVTVSPRSNGKAVALTLAGGQPIDISGFKIKPLNPRRADSVTHICAQLEPWDIDTGCMDGNIDSSFFDGTPAIGANNEFDVPTKVAQVGDVYAQDELCVDDNIIIPVMNNTAIKYGLIDPEETLPGLSGPERFTNMAMTLERGALRKQFPELGPPQKVLVPMTGSVPTPPDLRTRFAKLATDTNNSMQAPENLDPAYCVNNELITQVERDNLAAQIESLTMWGIAPDKFDPVTMTYQYNNQALVGPSDADKLALGIKP